MFLCVVSIVPKLVFLTKTLDIPQNLSNQIVLRVLNAKF